MATPSPEDLEAFHRMIDGPRDSHALLIIAVEVPVVILMLLVVCLRFYTRTCIKKTLGLDDWVMGLASAIATIETVLNCVATRFGIGTHIWNLDYSMIPMGSKLGYVYQVLFTPAVTLCKLSICMTYLRIFPSKTDRLFCHVCIVLLTMTGVGSTTAIILQCLPVNSNWDLSITNKKCYNQKLALTITSAFNTTTDLAVFLWPAQRLWVIRIPLKQRLGLIFVFSLGCIVCVAGIARIYLYRDYFTSKDVFYNGAALFVLSSIECNLAILCGSLPGIRPLISQFVSRAAPTLSPDDRPPRQRAPGRVPNATETSASAGSWVILSIRAPEQRMIHMKEGRHYSVLDEDSRKETSRKADEDEERLPKKDSSH